MRRMMAAVLVAGAGLIGFGLDSKAQVAPIGADEKPIAQSKSAPPPSIELPALDGKDKIKEVPPPALGALDEVPARPALEPPPSIQLLPRTEPEPQLIAPKKNSPAPVVVQEEMKIPPPERAFPEPPKMPRVNDAAPVVKPEVRQEIKPEMKPEPTVAPVPVPEKQPIPAITPTRAVAPSLSVEVRAPESVGIHQQLDYEIVVKNVGPVGVHQVRIDDELPKSVKYIGSDPVAELTGDKMTWNLGSMEANSERHVKVAVKPSSEGDWRSKPVVTFSAHALPVQVTVTKPKLQVAVNSATESGYVGEELPLNIEVKNIGNGGAESTVVRVQLSEGLFHTAQQANNREIEAELSNLAAGETRSMTLKVKVLKAGSQGCLVTAKSEGSTEVAARTAIQCNTPPLVLKITGTPKALVRAEPTFNLEVTNTEKVPSAPVQIAAAFPEGLEFVSATEGGGYDSEKRVVTWSVGAMLPNQKRFVTVKAKVNAGGTWAIRAVAQAGPRQEVRAEWVIQSEGVPGLNFEISSKENPVEVGKEATYEIRIVNQGTSPCTQIRLLAAMSEGMMPTTATMGDASLPFKMNGQTLVFDAISKLPGQSEVVIRLKARSTQAGDQRCKVQVGCDQLKQPIVKEESTFFFMQ